ncbi:peptide transporter [Labrenzia sp. CP4]|jgi:peptide/nickel transport system permease protein|uniref:ABC transporter permease n=1 Tax=Stappiaceae TaxID=2821832 RepID=UPI0007837866|nr:MULTISPECIES: ABC transporter permease [Stappiaceae]AMN52810.1 peptide transporter [Labrenzia sp. CP4]UES58576.1 ABC transporter permease subunit [Roseibium aggregatum]
MVRRLSHRLVQSVILLFLVSVAGFALLRLLPGDFAEVLLLSQMDGTLPDAAAVDRFSAENGFDDPLPVQYLRWLGNVLTGDLGTSFVTGESVSADILLRIRQSLILALLSIGLALVLAVPIGCFCAYHAGGLADRLLAVASVAGLSIPNFWYALLLALLFSLTLGWLPSSGHGTIAHAVLPTLVIATTMTGVIARFVRARLLDEFHHAYIRTAKAKGLSQTRILLHHALPNILPSLLTLTGLQFARAFDGMIIVETIFAWPGIGSLLVASLLNRDYPLIQICFLVIACGYIIINLLVDYLVTLADPRVQEAI